MQMQETFAMSLWSYELNIYLWTITVHIIL